jgi:hypothetical protein
VRAWSALQREQPVQIWSPVTRRDSSWQAWRVELQRQRPAEWQQGALSLLRPARASRARAQEQRQVQVSRQEQD